MEHLPTKHLHQLRRGLGHQDLGQGLQVGGWQWHDEQPCDENCLREKLGTVWRIEGLQGNHALAFIFSEVLSSLLTWTLNLVMWPGLLIPGSNLTVIKLRQFCFFAIFLESTVFAAVTIDGKVHVFDLHHDKYKPLCVQVKTNISQDSVMSNLPVFAHQGSGIKEPGSLDSHQLQLGSSGHYNRRQ